MESYGLKHFFLAFNGPDAQGRNHSDIYMSHLSLKDTQDFLGRGSAVITIPEAPVPKGK